MAPVFCLHPRRALPVEALSLPLSWIAGSAAIAGGNPVRQGLAAEFAGAAPAMNASAPLHAPS